MPQSKTALAVFAHPDDIEFLCAGTLALLKQQGWKGDFHIDITTVFEARQKSLACHQTQGEWLRIRQGMDGLSEDLHPMTLIQNARAATKLNLDLIPKQAVTVGPVQIWMADKVSIRHPGYHASPVAMRITSLMISKRIVDTAVPISLLADHPNVEFHFYAGGIGDCKPGYY